MPEKGSARTRRRHGYLLSMLGIRQLAVVVNKMDLVEFDRQVFESIRTEYTAFLRQLNVEPSGYIPVSGFHGDNIAARSQAMPWYEGPTVLETLDGFVSEQPAVSQPFRMPVQGVYKFTQQSDDRRIVAGTIDTGRVARRATRSSSIRRARRAGCDLSRRSIVRRSTRRRRRNRRASLSKSRFTSRAANWPRVPVSRRRL